MGSFSCTPNEWEEICARARREGKSVSEYVIERALTAEPVVQARQATRLVMDRSAQMYLFTEVTPPEPGVRGRSGIRRSGTTRADPRRPQPLRGQGFRAAADRAVRGTRGRAAPGSRGRTGLADRGRGVRDLPGTTVTALPCHHRVDSG